MSLPYPHLFFDLDGTLTDPKEGIVKSLRYAIEKLGIPDIPESRLTRFIGPPLQDVFSQILNSDSVTLIQNGIELYRERFSTIGLFENRKYEGIDAMLTELQSSGRRLWVVTSKPKIYADRILKHFELYPFFEDVYGPDLEGGRRDKAELIAFVMQQEKVAGRDALMIGDRSFDMIGARSNNVRAVGVLWGYGSPSELTGAGAWKICKRIPDLPRIVSDRSG